MIRPWWILLGAGAGIVLAAACGGDDGGGATTAAPAAGAPSIQIVTPENNATLTTTSVTVELQVENFTLKPPGGSPRAGEGHIHVYVDGTEEVISEATVHTLTLSPGSHEVVAVLVNNNHDFLDPGVSQQITVTVEAAAGAGGEASPTPTAGGGYGAY